MKGAKPPICSLLFTEMSDKNMLSSNFDGCGGTCSLQFH